MKNTSTIKAVASQGTAFHCIVTLADGRQITLRALDNPELIPYILIAATAQAELQAAAEQILKYLPSE